MKKQIVIAKAHKDTGELLTSRTISRKVGDEVIEETVYTVMVQSKSLANLSGIGGLQTRTAFITLREEAVEYLGSSLQADKPFPEEGKIVIRESLEPYISKSGKQQEPKINPTTKEPILYKGQPVYRNMEFTQDMDAQDVFLREVSTGVEVEAEQEEVVE